MDRSSGRFERQFYREPDTVHAYIPIQVIASGSTRWYGKAGFDRQYTSFWAIEYVTYGDGIFTQDGTTHYLKPGTVFLLRQGSSNRYSTGSSGMLHKRYIQIRGLAADQLFNAAGLRSVDIIDVQSEPSIGRLLKAMHHIMGNPSRQSPITASELAYRLIMLIGEISHQSTSKPVLPIIEWIQQHLDRPLKSRECADRAGISVVHLNRLMHVSVGKSLKEYIIDQKMNQAAHLLNETDIPVKQIASQVGYEDPLYFSDRFHKWSGMSPRKYRERARKQSRLEH
jgi:AraC-like DNA-binding protein